MTPARVADRSTAFQLWAIGALVPIAFLISGGTGKRDFDAFWIAGRQVLSGHVSEIYSIAATHAYTEALNLGSGTIFPYPPHALFLFLPFSVLPRELGYVGWVLATGLLFYWSAKPYLPIGFPKPLVLLTPASLICVDFGQTGLLFGALWLAAFRGIWWAVSIMSFKPHLGILSVTSFSTGAAILRAVALLFLITILSVLLFGVAIWAEFFSHTFSHVQNIDSFDRWLFAAVTPAIGYGFIGWMPFAVAACLLLARRPNVFTAATASFLVSPYGFHYDMPVACLGFGLLAYGNWPKMPTLHRIPVALGFLSPVIAFGGAWWVPPILLWALWVQTKYGDLSNGTQERS